MQWFWKNQAVQKLWANEKPMVGQESRVKHFAERQIFLDMQELIENCTNLQWSRNLKYGDSDNGAKI